MTLILQRTHEVNDTTFGKLYLNDMTFLNYTLEDKVRETKIKHQTAIPAGTYQIIINRSERFKQLMPLLLDVPNFEGIRIHKGNTNLDTSGCIIVGDHITNDKLLFSTTAYQRLFTLLDKTLKIDKVYIRIEDIPKPLPVISKPVELPKEIILPTTVVTSVKVETPIVVQPVIKEQKINWIIKLINIIKQWINN